MVSNCWNDNPAIEILSGGFDAPAGAELGTDWTVFFVAALKNSDKIGRLIDGHSGNYLLGFHGGYRNGIYWDGTASEYNTGISTLANVTDPHIYSYVRDNSNSSITAKIDGDILKTFYSTSSGSGIRLDINQGNYSNESTHSRIGEFIIYNTKLSDTQIQKVESYLAVKYGISVSDNDGGIGGDYISTSGTTYWDASDDTDFNNDVVVIGKDNNTASNQKQSKSYDDSLKVFISSLASSNSANAGTITNNNSFIAIGTNKGLLKSTSAANSEKPSGITSRLEREWKLTNSNFTDDFSIEIEWDSAGSFDLSHIRLLVDDDGDFSNATSYGTSDGLTFSIGSIIVGGVSSSIFGSGTSKYFTLGSTDATTTLPVSLINFKVDPLNNWNYISWQTTSEINNDYFIVEKSNDGENWFTLTEINGSGNSSSLKEYGYIDQENCLTTCYYRLTQVDYDGEREVFDDIIKSTNSNSKDDFSMSISPNPIQEKININYSVLNDGVYTLEIFNTQSKLIYESKILGIKGNNFVELNTSFLQSGNYIFIMYDENKSNKTIQRVVKL